jgi:polysaccharide biosynthesis protein VpsJ
MATTMASAGRHQSADRDQNALLKAELYASIARLCDWIEANDYRGYDTFDGLNARFVRPLTFETRALRMLLQQGIRRFPVNLRPLLGVRRHHSTKAMGFFARGFMRLYDATGEREWREKAEKVLDWLIDNQCRGYSGAGWGNHFDYQSRNIFVKKNVPSIVWTSLIGHAFLDAYEHFKQDRYLQVAVSSCEHIVHDISRHVEGDAACLGYFPGFDHQVHNASTLGAGLLIRTYAITGNGTYRDVAEKAFLYTAKYQRPDGSWYYGEASNLRWIDNFHTAYVLDCFKHYSDATGDSRFENTIATGYDYWKNTFFLEDGTPRYYSHKTEPIDIQCSAQAIDTLAFYRDRDPQSLQLATKVANWTIKNMQDRTGYFYYRRYGWGIVNKTPTLHWGQATMLAGLAGLYRAL